MTTGPRYRPVTESWCECCPGGLHPLPFAVGRGEMVKRSAMAMARLRRQPLPVHLGSRLYLISTAESLPSSGGFAKTATKPALSPYSRLPRHCPKDLATADR